MPYKAQHAWDQGKMIGTFPRASAITGVDKNYSATAGDTYYNTTLNEIREYDATYGWRPQAGNAGLSTRENFKVQPMIQLKGGGAAAVTDNAVNIWNTGQNIFEVNNINEQTLFAPTCVATGLDINMDETNTDGYEINQGILAGSKHHYVVGTTPAFHIQATLAIGDPTSVGACYVGFRSLEGHQNATGSYDSGAMIGVVGDLIKIQTIVAGSTETVTSTTDVPTDNTKYTYRVNVSAAGVCTFSINGAEPTTTKVFSLTAGQVVIPFIHLTSGGTLVDVVISDYEVGLDD